MKCRYGGDEFLLILPDTPAAGSRQLAESLRREMSHIALLTAEGELTVTVSLGVVTAAKDDGRAGAHRARRQGAVSREAQRPQSRVADEPETAPGGAAAPACERAS